jgi:cell wall-associated NlpC family hydrolase
MGSVLLDDLLSCKYELGGRGPNYDCFGLIIEVASRFGITILPEQTNILPQDNHVAFLKGVSLFTKLEGPEDYCMVLLAPHMKLSNHCGFVLEYPFFIHCWEKSNVSIEKLTCNFWKPRVRGFYR